MTRNISEWEFGDGDAGAQACIDEFVNGFASGWLESFHERLRGAVLSAQRDAVEFALDEIEGDARDLTQWKLLPGADGPYVVSHYGFSDYFKNNEPLVIRLADLLARLSEYENEDEVRRNLSAQLRGLADKVARSNVSR